MSDKVTLATLTSFTNDTTAVTQTNANNALITTAIDNTLSRDGTSPNQMNAALDMNGSRIINLPFPNSLLEPVRLGDLTGLVTTTNVILGSVIIPSGSPITSVFGIQGKIQLNSTSGDQIAINTFTPTSKSGYTFNQSRGVTIGQHVALQNGDSLGYLAWGGSDGTQFLECCSIAADVKNTVSTGSVPGDMVFETTAVGQSSSFERLRIDNKGNVFTGGIDFAIPSVFNTIAGFELNAATNSPTPTPSIAINEFSSTGRGSILLNRSKNNTMGTHTAVISGDGLGFIAWAGSDGTAFQPTAIISVQVDGTVAANSVPGDMLFETTAVGGTSAVERIRVNAAGSLIMSAAALSTSATDGFFYVNTCAGAPTGVPTASPGAAKAMVYDTTNNKLWIYNGSWRGVVLS